jgi:hypothetical protein
MRSPFDSNLFVATPDTELAVVVRLQSFQISTVCTLYVEKNHLVRKNQDVSCKK